MTYDCGDYNFFQNIVDGESLMVFQSEASFCEFLRGSVDRRGLNVLFRGIFSGNAVVLCYTASYLVGKSASCTPVYFNFLLLRCLLDFSKESQITVKLSKTF